MPMLLVSSPTLECGKSTAATLIGAVVPRSIMVSSLTPAVLFRMLHKYRPTLIADEVDSWLSDEKSELRGIFNAAHWRAGAVIPRCVGDAHEVELFNVFGAKLIAMIGRPPATMLSRSITITLRRKMAGERVEPLREDRLRNDLRPLRQQWRRWVLDHLEALRTHEPAMPPDLPVNRASDNWRPLLSIADLAGGSWPARARAAARALMGIRVSDDEPVNVALLADVHAVFRERGEPQYLSSEEIIVTLKALSERPWADWNKGRGLTPAQLASRLRDFGMGPMGLRTRKTRLNGDKTKTGQLWHREDFIDAWSRYVTANPEHQEQTNESGPQPAISNPEQGANVPTLKMHSSANVCGLCSGCSGFRARSGRHGRLGGDAMTEPTPDIFDSPVFPVVVKLDHDGFQFRLTADGRVEIRPISRLPADVRALFAGHRDELRLIVSIATDAGVHERRDIFRAQLATVPAPQVPAFLCRPGISYQPGVCFSCGDALPKLRFSRCWRCSLAWRLACRLPVSLELDCAIDAARVA